MRIYLKDNLAKFCPDTIWNDGALGPEEVAQHEEEQEYEHWAMIWDQFLI